MKFKVSFLYEVWSYIRTLFWKNENIIYINSNKKRQNKDNIDDVGIKTRKYKWLICESNVKLGYKFYRIHLLKMKHKLYDIARNSNDNNDLIYSGFVSPMFSSYDGYCIGDTRGVTFVDLDSNTSKPYKIKYEKNYTKSEMPVSKKDIVNVTFECSYNINCVDDITYRYQEKSGNIVDEKYLQNIYSFTRNVLDSCSQNNVKRVNFYIAAKQPVSFVIGTAIQDYHPIVYIYEFKEGKYCMPIIIQEGKLGK